MSSKVENAVNIAIGIANDDSHGYDQAHRWGSPDYDCSSLVITAYEDAGIKVKTAGASYTGNMKEKFIKCGFKDVYSSVNVRTGEGLKRGDVLLKEGSHTAMYIGDGKLVQASINENHKITGGKPGDQTGLEIAVRSYYNFPWNCVLRYPESVAPTTAKSTITYASHLHGGGWLGQITNYNEVNGDGYSGVYGKPIDLVMAKINGGSIEYRVHTTNGRWLPSVTGYDKYNNANGYAGNTGQTIDAVAVKASGINGTLKYRVHTLNGHWLPWVTGYNTNDNANGYAGNIGQKIDGIQMTIV